MHSNMLEIIIRICSEGLSKIAIYDINIFTLLIIRILIINVKTLKLSKFRNSTGDFLMPLIINDV